MRQTVMTVCFLSIFCCLVPALFADDPNYKGDLNGDGVVDFTDFSIFANDWLKGVQDIPPVQDISTEDVEYRTYGVAVHTEDFNNFAAWATFNGEVTLSPNSVNVEHYTDINDRNATLVTCTANKAEHRLYKNITSIDVRNCDMEVTFFVTDEEYAKSGTLYIELRNTAGTNVVEVAYDRTRGAVRPYNGGWRTVTYNLHQAVVENGTLLGTLSAVQQIRIDWPSAVAATPHNFTMDSIRFIPQPITGNYCLLSFDDSPNNDVNIAQYMAQKGLRGTFFVVTDRIDTGSYLTSAQLAQIKAWGHTIANHSSNHGYLTTGPLSPSDAITQITTASAYLLAHGYTRGSRIWAIPGGGELMTWKDDPTVLLPYVDLIRGTGCPSMAMAGCVQNFPYCGPIVFTHYFSDPTSDLAYLTADHLSGNSLFSFGFHSWDARVTTGDGLTTAMTNLLDYLGSENAAGTIKCITFNELAYGIYSR